MKLWPQNKNDKNKKKLGKNNKTVANPEVYTYKNNKLYVFYSQEKKECLKNLACTGVSPLFHFFTSFVSHFCFLTVLCNLN